jgi:hypothetical protein
MHNTFNSVKLVGKDTVDLDRLSYTPGDIVYDKTNNTLRIMDGTNLGGTKIATQTWTSSTITTALAPYATTASVSSSISNALIPYVTTTSLTTTLASYPTSSSLNTTLTNYETTANLATTLANYVTTSALTTALSTKANSNSTLIVNGTTLTLGSTSTITAAAGTLTGTTLHSTVVNSSLTSVGVLNTLEVAGDVTADANVVISNVPTLKTHATNKKYVDNRAIAISIAMS